jgi:hypothetical protein
MLFQFTAFVQLEIVRERGVGGQAEGLGGTVLPTLVQHQNHIINQINNVLFRSLRSQRHFPCYKDTRG